VRRAGLTTLLVLWLGPSVDHAVEPPPSIRQHGVVNAASRMPPSLGGGAIARGSLFRIEGLRLGPGNATVRVTRSGQSVEAVPIQAGAQEILAILPPDAPLGAAQLTVTFAGQTSLPYDLNIVPSSFGIFKDRIEQSDGVATLWGTGLGQAEPEVLVGGKAARIRYAGRSECCLGRDRIVFEIPPDAPRGCFVPVLVRTAGSVVSNVVTMPIGNPCDDPANWLARRAAGPRAGFAILLRSRLRLDLDAAAPVEFVADLGLASFRSSAKASPVALPPIGACTAFTGNYYVGQLMAVVRGGPLVLSETNRLDAGRALTVRGPRGAQTLPVDEKRAGSYTALLGGNPPARRKIDKPLYLEPGKYVIAGAGGPDAGPFRVAVQARRGIAWINKKDAAVVERAKGITVLWKNVGREEVVVIAAMNDDPITAAAGLCLCLAPAESGRFHIPPEILANIPATAELQDLPASLMLVGAVPARAPREIRARGLDAGVAFFMSIDGASVVYR
jgi:uncharacterized protein (TIGR03437 family)